VNISRLFILIFILVIFATGNASVSLANQDIIPPRTLLVANHLRTLPYEKVAPGIAAIKTVASNGIELIALRIKPAVHKFELIKQSNPQGNWVEEMGTGHDAQIAFNGGFFKINKKGHKVSVGLLAINEMRYSTAWKKSGGYLIFRDGNVSILETAGNPVPVGEKILQSKPVLIAPGGNWVMNTNRAIPKKRTLVCIDEAGDFVVLAIVGGGLSLFEAGWLMRNKNVGGFFGCDSAIAMDGGGSTQIWVKDRPDLSFGGETPVHNAVIIQQQ
jgi:exopolysaccharide biosynthesis protein